MTTAVRAEGLVKSFGATHALRAVDLDIEQGTVLAVLGPNGAGKTTAVRILTTLLPPDAGRAEVMGYDVVRQAQQVRAVIGLTGQFAAVDEHLTGLENLEMIGQLFQLPRAEARRRALVLLERFELDDAAGRPVRTYSGGMRRRLDLGASLVGEPAVLFLDEPTTGLDPRSRNSLWQVIRELAAEGTTLLLTTQYLEEADRLADDIAVFDHGLVIARGTADELKEKIGGEVLELRLTDPADMTKAVTALGVLADAARLDKGLGRIELPVGDDHRLLTSVPRMLDDAAVLLDDIAVRRPSLDDVFLTLTGHAAEEPVPS